MKFMIVLSGVQVMVSVVLFVLWGRGQERLRKEKYRGDAEQVRADVLERKLKLLEEL